jgi:hypothetical protein
MSAEKFMYRFIAALRSQSTMEFKESLRSVDVLLIDDLQFLIGKDNTQEEFFHTFNALVDAGKQIFVSSDKPPSDLAGIEDRLRTRLGCGMVADLHATTYELRISILQAKARRRRAGAAEGDGVPGAQDHLQRAGAGGRAEPADRARQPVRPPVTLEGAQEVLHDILRAHDRRVTIEEIQKRVAEHYNIRLTDMSSPRRRAQRGAAAPGGDVPGEAAHQPVPAGDRPPLRRARPHHGDARRLARRRADAAGQRLRRGCGAAAEDAGDLSGGRVSPPARCPANPPPASPPRGGNSPRLPVDEQ